MSKRDTPQIFSDYEILATYYDRWMRQVDYSAYADYYEAMFDRYLSHRPELVLDLGCGSGVMTAEMARRGYDMIGVDRSEEMLARARENTDGHNVLLLQQDMTSFELYGSVGAVISSLDCINYLTDTDALTQTFDGVFRYLDPGGLFLFDVNTVYKFETVLANNIYVYEDSSAYCVWENDYRPARGVCDFYLNFFVRGTDGRYTRMLEMQRERAWSARTLRRLLLQAGFTVCACVSDFAGTPAGEQDERHYYICQKG